MATILPRLIKRGSYNDYSKYNDVIPAVLQRLLNTKRGDIMKVHEETGIPYSTLSHWHQQLCKNTHFNPLNPKYGYHRKIFTDDEEDSIADFILKNYINEGLHFTDEDFKEIAMIAWQEKYLPFLNSEDENERKKFKNFTCSAGYIADFKLHHRFSTKAFHLKRRSNPNNEIEKRFMDDMKNLFSTVHLSRILNADETGWRLFPKGILGWGETGKDNVTRQATINEKTQVTVLATICADYTKLPLLFIAQGKTALVETTQIGDVSYHWKTHTESGWMNDEAFAFYLRKLREFYNDDETLHLIIDLYPAHMTDKVYEEAAALNIKLHIIPAGMTDVYQPLDRKIFGVMKAKARKMFRQRHTLGQPITATKLDACQDMCSAWESVGYVALSSAWSIYVENSEQTPIEAERQRTEEIHAHHASFVKSLRIRRRKVQNDDSDEYKSLSLE